jgi:hypothetical protein
MFLQGSSRSVVVFQSKSKSNITDLFFYTLFTKTTLFEVGMSFSGKYADFTCSSSGGEVEMSRSINRPEQSSWISNHNKTYNTSLGPLEDELVAGYAVILKKLKM